VPEAARYTLEILGAQALAAALLAAVLLFFARAYDYPQLWSWFRAWTAQAVYVVFAGLSLMVVFSDPGSALGLERTSFSLISLVATYASLTWLLLGAYQASTGAPGNPRVIWIVLGVAMAFGAITALIGAFDPHAAALREVLRYGLRAGVSGIALIAAGVLLWCTDKDDRRGRRFVSLSFVFLGGLNLLAAFSTAARYFHWGLELGFMAHIGILDILAYLVIGMALIVWLLDHETTRSQTAEGELDRAVSHDLLTSLPNRKRFIQRLSEEIDRANAAGHHVAVCLVDLDRFRIINDSLGYSGGDAVLQETARRLSRAAGEHGAVARLGDDEFAAILVGAGDNDEAMAQAESLRQVFHEPFRIWDREIVCHASVGVTVFPKDGHEPEVLMRNTGVALQAVRGTAGENALLAYSDDMANPTVEDLDFEQDLRRAAERGEFKLLFQPIVTYPDRRIIGAEALIRWQRNGDQMVRPDQFLPKATALGLMDSIDDWVIRTACNIGSDWAATHRPGFRLSVNLAAPTFQRMDLVERVEHALNTSGLPATALELEITEHSAMHDLDSGRTNLDGLRALGVGVCIDDFGTGYSSFAHLRDLPVDRVKIDRSFVARALEDARDSAIVQALISLARNLDLAIVAEGVEEERQARFLLENDCEVLQGYLFYRPISPDKLADLIESQG
jgi:diguanylate cyclase (GGDEF)-like protein